MIRVPRFPVSAFIAFLLIVGTGGCRAAENAASPAPPPLPEPVPTMLAGVRYDPAAPLRATVRPLFDAKKPPSGSGAVLSYAVGFRGGDNALVPGLLTVPLSSRKGEKRPCIILLHGLGGNKSNVFLIGVALARRGYASFAIDIAGHGERPKIEGKAVFDLSLPQMRRLSAQTVLDLRRAVDFLGARPEIDRARIGFVGISLGGIVGSVFVAEEPRVRAAVLWAAGGDWGGLITRSAHPFAQRFRKTGVTDPAKIAHEMADVEPTRYIAQFAPRPLLLINGDRDTVVPRASTDALYRAAREPKQMVFLQGGHIPDLSAMLAQTLDWLVQNMKP